jgi:outer membrane protein assembly factor BamE (lipoprotein component of BamABCDE complex)
MRTGIEFRSAKQGLKMVLSAVALGAFVAGCAPVIRIHGYMPKAEDLAKLEEGSHSQREIERLLGSPTAVATFDNETWYYINAVRHTYAWKEPVVVNRQIVAIRFDEESKLIAGIDRYTQEDGRLIAFSSDKTPTKGRELSFLEQLLGNVGRVSTSTFDDQITR